MANINFKDFAGSQKLTGKVIEWSDDYKGNRYQVYCGGCEFGVLWNMK